MDDVPKKDPQGGHCRIGRVVQGSAYRASRDEWTYDRLGYICGPISAETQEGEDANLELGILVAEWASREGIPCISPHANSREFTHGFTWNKCLGLDITCLDRCDFILALPGWEKSAGCRVEVAYARNHRIPVFYTLAEVLCYVQSSSTRVPLRDKL